jgi:nucleoside-diphosphate-sugar epimerase
MGLKGIENKEIKCPEGSVLRRVPSIEKAKKQLDWQPEVGFDEGVKNYLTSLRG